MNKIAIYTLTRDRLEFTKHCFQTLWDKAGVEFDWYIIDNGSQDGTVEWLKENESQFKKVIYNPENVGISKASNQALEEIFRERYDLIIKFDNDCEVVSENILEKIIEIFKDRKKLILSPNVEGIDNQPKRGRYEEIAGHSIGMTAVVGGLFHIVPAEIYQQYRYPENLPKAKGQDELFCSWVKATGYKVGYIEDLTVNHYMTTGGQYKHNPGYFERKWQEEK